MPSVRAPRTRPFLVHAIVLREVAPQEDGAPAAAGTAPARARHRHRPHARRRCQRRDRALDPQPADHGPAAGRRAAARARGGGRPPARRDLRAGAPRLALAPRRRARGGAAGPGRRRSSRSSTRSASSCARPHPPPAPPRGPRPARPARRRPRRACRPARGRPRARSRARRRPPSRSPRGSSPSRSASGAPTCARAPRPSRRSWATSEAGDVTDAHVHEPATALPPARPASSPRSSARRARRARSMSASGTAPTRCASPRLPTAPAPRPPAAASATAAARAGGGRLARGTTPDAVGVPADAALRDAVAAAVADARAVPEGASALRLDRALAAALAQVDGYDRAPRPTPAPVPRRRPAASQPSGPCRPAASRAATAWRGRARGARGTTPLAERRAAVDELRERHGIAIMTRAARPGGARPLPRRGRGDDRPRARDPQLLRARQPERRALRPARRRQEHGARSGSRRCSGWATCRSRARAGWTP